MNKTSKIKQLDEQMETTGLDIEMQGTDESFPEPKETWIFILKSLTVS